MCLLSKPCLYKQGENKQTYPLVKFSSISRQASSKFSRNRVVWYGLSEVKAVVFLFLLWFKISIKGPDPRFAVTSRQHLPFLLPSV